MSFESILDIAILILLGVTIVYAAKLSIYLKAFRDGRKDMNYMLQDLSSSMARAENTMKELQASADQSGLKLQDVTNEAKFLSDELRFMNEAGDSLADRLEKLADRNRELVELLQQSGGVGYPNIGAETAYQDSYVEARPQQTKKVAAPSGKQEGVRQPHTQVTQHDEEVSQNFAIQDRDFEEELQKLIQDEDSDEELFYEQQVQQTPQPSPSLKSKAEQELYEALRRRTTRKQQADKVS